MPATMIRWVLGLIRNTLLAEDQSISCRVEASNSDQMNSGSYFQSISGKGRVEASTKDPVDDQGPSDEIHSHNGPLYINDEEGANETERSYPRPLLKRGRDGILRSEGKLKQRLYLLHLLAPEKCRGTRNKNTA